MNYLITGGEGYIGSHLTRLLKENNNQVYSVGRVEFDLSNYSLISEYLNGKNIDAIIHLASEVNNKDKLFEANIVGLYNLLRACSEKEIPYFIFASTNNVYGITSRVDFSETMFCNPDINNMYGISKLAGEMLVKEICQEKKIGYSIIRIADVYGKDQRHGNLIKALVSNIKESKNLQQFGEGIRERDYIYITDVVEGIEFILINKLQGIYNLGTGKGTTVKELLEIASQLSGGRSEIEKNKLKTEDTTRVVLNVEKINNAGFKAKTSIKDGLKMILED